MNTVGGFLRDTWRLARPYFAESEERWSARGLLAVVIGLALANVGNRPAAEQITHRDPLFALKTAAGAEHRV